MEVVANWQLRHSTLRLQLLPQAARLAAERQPPLPRNALLRVGQGGASRRAAREERMLELPVGIPGSIQEARTEAQLEAIATAVVLGIPKGTIATEHGFSSAAELGTFLAKHPQIPQLVEQKRAFLELGAQSLYAKAMLSSHAILNTMVGIATDRNHTQCVAAGMKLLDRTMPAVTHVSAEHTHMMSMDVAEKILTGITELQGMGAMLVEDAELVDEDPHLHDGAIFIEARDSGMLNVGTEE